MNDKNQQQIEADDHIRKICLEIIVTGRTASDWDEYERYDIFAAGPYEGGYDTAERKFIFSYYSPEGVECWIGFDLEVATMIANGEVCYLDVHKAHS